MTKEKIAIILPNKIGDSILSLPAILCLKQLQEHFGHNETDVTLFSYVPSIRTLNSFDLFKVKPVNWTEKIKTWLAPYHKAFFLVTTSKNLGFRSKKSFGLINAHKKLLRYSVNLDWINFPANKDSLPDTLVNFLREKYDFSDFIIKNFGLCLEFGYTVDQILSVFNFNLDSFTPKEELIDLLPQLKSNYVVFCMEAAYGRMKNNADRRWNEEYFLELAERLHKEDGINIVFIGINNEYPIPARPYFIDMRQKLNLDQTFSVLKFSKGYVGNDTGPLHMANLMKKNSVGLYFREAYLTEYGPVFSKLNKKIFKPATPDDVYPALKELVSKEENLSTCS